MIQATNLSIPPNLEEAHFPTLELAAFTTRFTIVSPMEADTLVMLVSRGINFFAADLASEIAAGVAVAGGLANVAAIVKTKTPGTGGGGGGGSTPTRPSIPSFNPEEALAAGAAGDDSAVNEVTLGQQSGSTPGVIRAYVVSDEMTTQQEADAKINDLARL